MSRKRYDKKTLRLILAEMQSLHNSGFSHEEIRNHLNDKTDLRPARIPAWTISAVQQLMSHYRIVKAKDYSINSNIVTRPMQTKFNQDAETLRQLILTADISAQFKIDTLISMEKNK